jgi:hypothetical protein
MAISLLEEQSCQHPTTIPTESRSEWLLAVLFSENGPQEGMFCSYGGDEIEYDGQTVDDFKRSLSPVLPTVAQSMEKVCMLTVALL